jgi:hypothetical protein
MDDLSKLVEIIKSSGRRVYVVERELNLSRLGEKNTVYILELPTGSNAAGGRGGGFGERRITKVYHFECGEGLCRKVGEVEDDERLDALDLPYHATAMPIIDSEGKEKLVSGVIDASFVGSYRETLG